MIQDGADITIRADLGGNLLELARNAGVYIDAPCGANGVCGKCRVRIVSGEVKSGTSRHITDADHAAGWRLACCCTVEGDSIIEVPDAASDFRTGIQTAGLSSTQEQERYSEAIDAIFAADVKRGCAETGIGVAIDIGTTTVGAAMLDLRTGALLSKASAGNAQIRYGADVINRIIASTREGGRADLRAAILDETLIPLVSELSAEVGVDPLEITRCVVAGNTTMEHLFLAEDAESIRLEPYEPAFLEKTGLTAGDAGLPFRSGSKLILAPNVGSYVGGDITSGVLTSMIWNMDGLHLLIDLGTNGELVLGNRDFLLCCACSAGPAFEGGEISCGMRATAGAIESVRIDADSMTPTPEIIGDENTLPAGICGSGLIDLVAELFRCGIIDASGKFTGGGGRVRRDEYGGASFIVAFAHESATGSDIVISEIDIDNFIRAKAAIFSAIRVMLNSLDMTVEMLSGVQIAGGIGSGISVRNAVSIGMLPALQEEKYSYVGNTSLTGACAMLLSDDAADKVFDLGRNMTYLELSSYPGYMDEFIAACFLPHTDARLFGG